MSDIQVKEKHPAEPTIEQTRPGKTFVPAVDIFENETEITVIADIPGVRTEDLDIDLRENILTISGEVRSQEGAQEQEVIREYDIGAYVRQFTLSEVIDQARIDARLEHGVLRLILPKVAKATPRKIAVKTG